MKRFILIVLDSVGIGAAPDADRYDDTGSATLPNLARAAGGINAPTLSSMGLGNAAQLVPSQDTIEGVPAAASPIASYGIMQEVSEGKDTITGHWEIAGLDLRPGFSLFPEGPPSFSDELLNAFKEQTGRDILGNHHASGTKVIEQYGEEHMNTGAFIVYTSADSVFQIAAHTDVVPIEELYRACEIARELCNPLRVGRVIARPFIGSPGTFERTRQRKDYAFVPDEPTILERVKEAGIPVCTVGKIDDIFAHRGLTETDHTGDNLSSQAATVRFTQAHEQAFIFANFIDFDMVYGHRRDPKGYAKCIEQSDEFFKEYLPMVQEGDVLVVTADHGNDPTFKGSDHTREYVPLLVYEPGKKSRNLGVREGFYDVAQSVADYYDLSPLPRGKSFL